MQEHKKIILGIVIVGAILLIVGFLLEYQKKPLANTNKWYRDFAETQNVNASMLNTNPQPEEITSTEYIADWKTYRNEELGFEITYPRKNRDGVTISAVEIVEDGNVVYIMPTGDYREKITKNIQSAKTEVEKTIGIPWAIVVKSVNSDNELEFFIRERYHPECKLGKKVESTQAGVYDVSIESSLDELGKGCFINWISVIKYHPRLHIVAAWDVGQDANFYSATGEVVEGQEFAIDFQVANSFRFLDN